MLNQDTILSLKKFGLTEYESRTYLVLNIYGSSIASFISKHTRIPSSKIYDILNSLRAKGMVEICSTKPKKFRAIGPNHALASMIETRENGLRDLKIVMNNVVKQLKPLEESDKSQIWSSMGRKMFYSKAAEVLRNSQESAISITSKFPRNSYIEKEFLDAVKRGVNVKMLGIGELSEESMLRASWYLKNGAEIRTIPIETKSVFGINDVNELAFKVNTNRECDFIWSKNIALVSIMRLYFDHLWNRSEPMPLCSLALLEK
ncbi:MAG: hypothetical protein KJ906_00465 [Nanoarchaeota archaeon]|nr:hypothetical protein [Nanoarchaeota archaeon]